MFKKFIAVGEERLNAFANQLLANEALMHSVQAGVQTVFRAKDAALKTVKAALTVLNVPTLDDMRRLEEKLDEVNAIFDDIRKQLDHPQD